MENEATSSAPSVNSGQEAQVIEQATTQGQATEQGQAQEAAPQGEHAQNPGPATDTSEHTAPTEGHAGKDAEHQFDPVMGQYLPTANFLVFVLLAYFFLRNPVRKAMKSRRENYLKLFSDAQKLKAEAEIQAKEIAERYGRLEQDIQEILSNASKAAEIERNKIILEANAAASHIKREAERIVATELAAARLGLQQEIMASAKAEILKKIDTEFKGDLAAKYSRSLVVEIAKA